MPDEVTEQEPPKTFEQVPQVGRVELDRYCLGCGYNLREQAVRREPATNLLLCRCPECGAFEPANQATTASRRWFAQLVLVLWLVWILAGLGLVAGTIAVCAELSNQTADLSKEAYRLDAPIFLDPRPGEAHSRQLNYEYRIRALDLETGTSLLLFLAGAIATGAVLTGLATVLIPHWPRRGYVRLAIAWPIVALIIMFLNLAQDKNFLEAATLSLKLWLFASAVIIALLATLGGVGGAWLGRPTARRIVRMMIPPRGRGPFAYLWLTDDQSPPGIERSG